MYSFISLHTVPDLQILVKSMETKMLPPYSVP